MKKIIAMLLILLLIPICVHAEEDPIVGVWYMDAEMSTGGRSIIIATYEENFTITMMLVTYNDGFEAKGPAMAGVWVKTDTGYTLHFLNNTSYEAYIKDGKLYGGFVGDNLAYVLRKMTPANNSKDFIRLDKE